MKAVKTKIIVSIIFLCISVISVKGQIFNGKLNYKFSTNDSIFFKDSLLVKIASEIGNPTNSITTVSVKKNRLFSTTISSDSRILFYQYQNKDTVYLLEENRKKREKLANNLFATKKPLSKSEDFKFILGFRCKKYLYSDAENPEYIFVAWIPDNFQFKGQSKNGKFFSNYFFPDGLAFRIEMIWRNIISTHELTRIEMYDVSDSEFEIKE
jgi:hypothetical protein